MQCAQPYTAVRASRKPFALWEHPLPTATSQLATTHCPAPCSPHPLPSLFLNPITSSRSQLCVCRSGRQHTPLAQAQGAAGPSRACRFPTHCGQASQPPRRGSAPPRLGSAPPPGATAENSGSRNGSSSGSNNDSNSRVSDGGGRGRHPELLRTASMRGSGSGSDGGGGGAGEDKGGFASILVTEVPRPEEVDERYRRSDYSDVFQFEARQAFARCIAGGEPRMRLAEAALHVTAEDDAIASHSTVAFPVAAWTDRIERIVDQLCAVHLRRAAAAAAAAPPPPPQAATASPSSSSTAAAACPRLHEQEAVAAEAAAVLQVVERYLFEEVGFRAPDYGRSNIPPGTVVDHAGVWEDARLGYLHETLIRRLGHPATLGLLLGEVCNRLLARGLLPCAAAVDTRAFLTLPRAVPLPQLTREVLLGAVRAGGGGDEAELASGSGGGWVGLNTCTSEVLVEMLRHLKRSYWPFAWDSGVDAVYPGAVGSHGGFRSAAKAAMGDEMSAVLAAIGKVAAWRLERGIWTSPGAGDMRRARAACERLVLLAGERCLEERRDLAVLMLHCGDVGAARLELRTYMRSIEAGATMTLGASAAAAAAVGATAAAPFVAAAGGGGSLVRSTAADPFDLALCRRLLAMLEGMGSAVEEPGEPLGVEAALRAEPPWQREEAVGNRRYLPLTW